MDRVMKCMRRMDLFVTMAALIHCLRRADESKSDSSQSLLQDYVLRQISGEERKNDASKGNKNESFLSNYVLLC